MFANLAYCQDVLYTTAGSKLKGKVTEINTKDIKYKDFNNLDLLLFKFKQDKVIIILSLLVIYVHFELCMILPRE